MFDTAATDALASDIAMINEGWSAGDYIIKRAVALRTAIAEHDTLSASILADEIDALQQAAGVCTTYETDAGSSERWQIDLEVWANILIGGGFKRTRFFIMHHGATVDQARAQACSNIADLYWCEPTLVPARKKTFVEAA